MKVEPSLPRRIQRCGRRSASRFGLKRKMTMAEYLAGSTDGIPNDQVLLEEMVMLWLANLNPAFAPFLELFDDTRLEQSTQYPRMMTELRAFFDTQPRFGPDNLNLIDMLRAPALAHPHWNIHPPKFDVAYALMQSIEGLDLVRAQLLTEIV